ncbi:MAG: putative DCC family thiol-disulfide oxidoreductase YuxK [Arenicella sp.]|jgi:predicted DCC family thiol-disulfide oxidoreductase YuxK
MNLKAPLSNLPDRLVIFDGVCNFCNASSNFIIKRDPSAKFTFTTVQSELGVRLLSQLGIDSDDPNTFVLIKNSEVYLKSSAALEIAKELTGAWSLASYLIVIPSVIRDSVYGLIARNRYALMGKRDTCMVPSAEVKARFID